MKCNRFFKIIYAVCLSLLIFTVSENVIVAALVKIPVEVRLPEEAKESGAELVLTANEKESPMPQGSKEGLYRVRSARGFVQFEINFPEAGEYRYKLTSQSLGDLKALNSGYDLKVRILEDETCQVAAFNHEGEKCEAAFEFTGSEEKIEAFTEISESSSEVESKTSGETGSDVSESRVKNKTAPDTSDFVNVFYFWLMLISAGGISAAALYIIFKKKQE